MASVRQMTAGVIAAVASAGMALSMAAYPAPAAQAAEPVTAANCREVQPATLTGTSKWVDGRPVVSFEGTLADGAGEGACVKIPVHQDLTSRVLGDYPALDKDGGRVGTMIVEAKLITFVFDDTYVAGHTDVTFHGAVSFGLVTHYDDTYDGYTLKWVMPREAGTVSIEVPSCPNCALDVVWGGKFTRVEPDLKTIVSGVTLGTEQAAKVAGWRHRGDQR